MKSFSRCGRDAMSEDESERKGMRLDARPDAAATAKGKGFLTAPKDHASRNQPVVLLARGFIPLTRILTWFY